MASSKDAVVSIAPERVYITLTWRGSLLRYKLPSLFLYVHDAGNSFHLSTMLSNPSWFAAPPICLLVFSYIEPLTHIHFGSHEPEQQPVSYGFEYLSVQCYQEPIPSSALRGVLLPLVFYEAPRIANARLHCPDYKGHGLAYLPLCGELCFSWTWNITNDYENEKVNAS